MSALVIGLGVLVAPIAAWVVYWDAARHGRSRATDPWAALAVYGGYRWGIRRNRG